MSTVYYIVNKKERDEYNKYCKFLDKEKEKLKKRFIEYGEKVNGILVNKENIEDDVNNKINSLFINLSSFMEQTEIRFGQMTGRGFSFFCDFTCEGIRDMKTLEDYLNSHKDCIIIDEYNKIFTFDKFKKELKNIKIY